MDAAVSGSELAWVLAQAQAKRTLAPRPFASAFQDWHVCGGYGIALPPRNICAR